MMIAHNELVSFVFDYAQYQVRDKHGVTALLKIHYAANGYEIETGVAISKQFRKELQLIAADLLHRKHGLNFIDRV